MKRNINLIMIIVLLSIMLLSSCNNMISSELNSEIRSKSISSDCEVTVSSITSGGLLDTEFIPGTSVDNQTAPSEPKETKYVYAPPIEAFEIDFAVDNIVRKVEYSYYRNSEFNDLPRNILYELNSYATANFIATESERLMWIGVDKFDINTDGIDDYIIEGQVMSTKVDSVSAGDYPHQHFNRIYISDNGEYCALDFPASKFKCNYILSNISYGYNSFIGDSSNGLSLIYFDGSEYVTQDIGVRYSWEYLDNSMVKISCELHQIVEGYIIAKCLYDSDVIQHTLLYSSLPNGSPDIPSDGKVEFYIKLTEYAPQKQNDFWIGPIEIKYVAVE